MLLAWGRSSKMSIPFWRFVDVGTVCGCRYKIVDVVTVWGKRFWMLVQFGGGVLAHETGGETRLF